MDARYERQSYELSVPAASSFDADALASAAEAFHDRHRQTYGHDNRGEPVQIVSLRVSAIGKIPALAIRQEPQSRRRASEGQPRRSVQRRDFAG